MFSSRNWEREKQTEPATQSASNKVKCDAESLEGRGGTENKLQHTWGLLKETQARVKGWPAVPVQQQHSTAGQPFTGINPRGFTSKHKLG